MATIENLDKKSISNMTQQELFDLLKEIRHSRRTPTRKAKPKKVKKAKKDPMENMTDQQMEELLKQLEDKL